MEQTWVTCTDNDKVLKADILNKSDKHIKVSIVGTITTLTLSRSDLGKPYVGRVGSLEFITYGDTSYGGS